MENFTQSFKKITGSYGVIAALVIGFAGGIFFQSFNVLPQNFRSSMRSNVAGIMPGVGATEGATGTICGLAAIPVNDEKRGQIVTSNDFTNAGNAYQAAHPDNPVGSATWGGIIGKEYLIAVINSLSSTETNVRFCYATEANQKTSIYFKGGTLNPVTGKEGSPIIVAKTGSSADAYCPTHCND